MSVERELTSGDKLEVFRRATALLASSTDFAATLQNTIAACLPALGDFGFFDVVVDGTPEHGVVRRASCAHEDPRISAILAPTAWVRSDRTDVNLCALSSGAAALHSQIDDAWYQRIAADEGHLAVLRDLAFCSMLTVPMRYRDELVGSLTLFFGRSGRHHTDADRELAQDLATLAVPAVVNARLVERHRRVEEALRDSEEHLRLALDAGRAGVWEWSIAENRIIWSDRVYDLHGVARGEFGGTVEDFVRLVHVEDRARVQAVLDRALASEKSFALEFRTPLPEGASRWLATRADIFRDAAGVATHMLGATIDITERMQLLDGERAARTAAEAARAEAELARRDAEHASRAKDEFLAILGHELRNPLAPIVSALELLERRGDMAGRRERDVIGRQVAHLSRLVDDLLDVSRIVGGKVDLHAHPLDLALAADKAVEMTRPLFDQRKISLDVRLERCWVQGDPIRIAQIVSNLLTNAAKFTPAGGRATLDVRTQGDQVVLEVTDNGDGIAADLLPSIFGLFVQGEQPLDRRQGGLGLGLAIVANLVAIHGGTVVAESAGAGKGSTFRVCLPRIPKPETVEPAAPIVREGKGQGRVLLVDDNVDAAELLADFLRATGYDVSVESSAPQALVTATQFRPDLAILDIGLPDMDGYELARLLRARAEHAGLRLIALTGYGRASDREMSRAAGFDHHFVKPVTPSVLLQKVEQLLAR